MIVPDQDCKYLETGCERDREQTVTRKNFIAHREITEG
jgi:hypothetical protein